jgi:hypothetical protein
MSQPALEDFEGGLNAQCMALLGDSLTYTPVSGSPVTRGYVDYRDVARDIQTGQIIAQDIMVQILRTDAPVRPSSSCRVALGKIAGTTFRPINIRRDESGDHWEFELEAVDG